MTFEIMTARVTSQPTVGPAQTRMAHSRTSNSSRNDDSSSGGKFSLDSGESIVWDLANCSRSPNRDFRPSKVTESAVQCRKC